MLRYLYDKHPKLLTLGIIACLGIIVYCGLLVVDSIQKEMRPEPQYSLDLEKKEEVKVYDVEGLTEEEIDQLLNRGDD